MHRYVTYAVRYGYSRFISHRPVILSHSLTNRCNSRCAICNVWRRSSGGPELSTREVERLLDDAWSQRFVAYVALGGEPLLRGDAPEILAHARSLGFYNSMITNGSRLEELASEVVPSLDLVWVSLDHDSVYHDEMRGFDGSFEAAVRGITAVRRLGGRARVNCVLSAMNLDAPERMTRLARRLGVQIAFDPMEVFPGNEEHALTRGMRRDVFGRVLALKEAGAPILNSSEFLRHQIAPERYECSQPRVFLKVEADGSVNPFWCRMNNGYRWDLRRGLGATLASPEWREFTELSRGCSSCQNSSTVESSVFYDAFRFATKITRKGNPYFRFIRDFGYS